MGEALSFPLQSFQRALDSGVGNLFLIFSVLLLMHFQGHKFTRSISLNGIPFANTISSSSFLPVKLYLNQCIFVLAACSSVEAWKESEKHSMPLDHGKPFYLLA